MTRCNLRDFDYKKLARQEAGAWQAYYNHRFIRMFFLLLMALRTQLKLNWLLTLRLAWHSARAAATYRLRLGREDYASTLKSITSFYEIISGHCTEPFNHQKAAKLELEWWDIHRYPERYEKSLEQSVAEASAIVYGVNVQKLEEYARFRAKAMALPNHQGDKQTNPPDYKEITSLLLKSWGSLHAAVQR